MSERDWLGLELVEAQAATREQLERVHGAAHVDSIEAISARGGGSIDLDTIASEGSWEAALHAAGGAVQATERLLEGARGSKAEDASSGMAFCGLRPPGHHAERDRAMGFCLFNNVAVAAAHAIAELGAERVLVLDWDVHHGNGTEAIFYDSPEVLYASIHQSPLYPGTGAATDFGRGAGEGYRVNLPVPPVSGPAGRPLAAEGTARATRSTCRCHRGGARTSSCRSFRGWARRSPATGGPACSASPPAMTRTAMTRSPTACSTTPPSPIWRPRCAVWGPSSRFRC